MDVMRNIERLRAYARSSGASKAQLARSAGLAERTLWLFWDDTWNPSLRTIQRLESIVPADFRFDPTAGFCSTAPNNI